MSGPEMVKTAEMAAKTIAARIEDPAKWMLAVRRLAEALRLDVTRAIPLAPESLKIACVAVVNEAAKQSRTATQIAQAIETI